MKQIDGLPPPDGFLRGDGFHLQPRPFLIGPALAELVPHNGLITTVMGSEMKGFPVEEYIHQSTITRNPDLVATALIDYWHGRTGADIRPITAWAPFVEATHNVYVAAHTDAKPATSGARNGESLNHAFEAWYIDQAREWQQQPDSESPTDAQSQDEHRPTRPEFKNQVNLLMEKLTAFISRYKAQGLQHQHIDEEWLREGEDFIILLLVELFLPFTAASRILERTGTWIHTAPPQCWAATSATLDVWTAMVDRGISPFPMARATPSRLFQQFEPLWAGLTTTTMGLIATALLSPAHAPYLVRSFPALFHNVNPHSAVQWFGSPHHVYRGPVLVILQDEPECAIIDSTRNRTGLHALVREIWHEYKQCSLYLNLDAWQLTTTNRVTYQRKHFTRMALQLWAFLGRVETLWHDHRDDPTAVACTHCQALLELLSSNPYLANALELRLFTKIGLQPLLDAARQYIPWIEQEVTQTYRQNPFLTHQGEAVYRQLPFHGLP